MPDTIIAKLESATDLFTVNDTDVDNAVNASSKGEAESLTENQHDRSAGGDEVIAEPTNGTMRQSGSDDRNDPDELHDLATDVDDPLPFYNPAHRTGPEDLDGVEFEDDIFYPDPAKPASGAAIACIAGKLGVPSRGKIEVGRLNLSEHQLSALSEGSVVRIHTPIDTAAWSPLALGREDRVAPTLVGQRVKEVEAMGQCKPCRARLLPDGKVELLTGMAEWLAVKHMAAAAGHVGTVLVDLQIMDDPAARKIVYAEAAEGVKVAPIDLARWASDAIKATFGTQRALARALGIDESNVTRLMAIKKTVEELDGAITDAWAVLRNQADRFMALWNEKGRRTEVRSFVSTLQAASAAKTFRVIFDHFGKMPEKHSGYVDVVGDDDQIHGRVRATKKGSVIVELDHSAGSVELPQLTAFIMAALGQVRANAG